MKSRLYEATAQENATSLLDLLKDAPLILDRFIVGFYDETLLHIAAMSGHVKFVDEILEM